jgi:hypothetical protein
VLLVSSLRDAIRALSDSGPGTDLCEFSGFQAEATTVSIRRQLASGRILYLTTRVDLSRPEPQNEAVDHLQQHKCLIAIMAPRCHTLETSASYDQWHDTYERDLPQIQFYGRVAATQLQQCGYFACVQSRTTWLTNVTPWIQILADANVGMMPLQGTDSTLVSNSLELLSACSGTGTEAQLRGSQRHNACLFSSRAWPRSVAEQLVEGISAQGQSEREYVCG